MPASDIVRVYQALMSGGFDMAKTYRITRGDGILRLIISLIFNIFLKLLFPKVKVKDANSKPKIFTREDSIFFHKRHVERTHNFYLKYGAKAIVLARFIPIVRTFTPILAGVGTMSYGTFLKWNIVGGVLWGAGVTLLSYFLGAIIPGIDRYLLPIVISIIVVSFLPIAFEFFKSRTKK